MKALVTISIVIEVDDEEEGAALARNMDAALAQSMAAVLAEHGLVISEVPEDVFTNYGTSVHYPRQPFEMPSA